MPPLEPPRITTLRLTDNPSGAAWASEVRSGPEEWYSFASGYKSAADVLADRIERDPWRESRIAAPMLFLYRHSIELHLKSLLVDAGELLDEPQEIPPLHYLQQLWGRVRELLLRIDPDSAGEWFKRADQIICDFDALDQGSFACRYPVNKANSPSLPPEFRIEAGIVRQMIAELGILLEGASAQIDVYMGFKHEMLRNLPG